VDRTPDRADPTEHFDLDVLADAAEGLLDDRAARAVDDHLAGCAACRERAAALTDVTRALAALPDPVPPPDLAERIDLAIADEQASAPASGQPTLTVLASGKRPADRWRVLATAATVAALVGGIGYASFHTGSEGGGGAASSNGSGGAGSARAPSRDVAAPVIRHSGTDYTEQSLEAAVPSLVRETVTASGDVMGRTSSDRSFDRTTLDPQLSTCSRNLGQSPGQLAAVDYARFDSASRIVMVFRTGVPGRVRVYVVPTDCAAKGASLIPTTVLNDVPASAAPSP
jgi:hypothetical protein